MRLCAPRTWFSRLVLALLCAIPAFVAAVNAQVAGRNVNMVSGGTFPGGDPHLQKQNEPSLAMSTRNPCHILAGANDYRAVNLPGLPADVEIGDAWLGWYESTDCGATWYSTLVPGYLQDASPAGMASPVKGLTAGADPVVRSGAAGTFYYLFIAFNRGSNVGKLALARAIDHNDREAFVDPNAQKISPDGTVNPRRLLSPMQYVDTIEVARGSAGKFIDKPSLAVFPSATGTCLMDGETVPATNVYTAWTEFVGNSEDNLRTKVYFARSVDCGKNFEPATKLSEGYPIGQGTVIAVNPNNRNEVYVVWRQIRSDRGQDALLFVRSTDAGRSFTKAEYIPGFGEGQFRPFDQNTTSKSGGSLTTTFRTVAYPTLAFADDGYLYMAVSQVPAEFHTPGALGGAQARIYMTRANSAGWQVLPPSPVVEDVDAAGQQFMPALAYAAGKMQLIWYDVRFDEAFDPFQLTSKPLIDDAEALATAARRRTIDVLGAQANFTVAGGVVSTVWPPVFTRYGVSQPDYNDTVGLAIPSRGPRVSQYLTGDAQPGVNQTPAGARQLLFNRGGLELYGGGTIPFIGDYIDVAPISFYFNAATGKWDFNGALANATKASLQTFQAAWTDNRDAMIGKAATETLSTNPLITRFKYEMPLALNGGLVNDAQCPDPGVDNTRSRDANVYTSRVTQDFSFTAISNSKHNAAGVIRSFAVQLANTKELDPNAADAPTTYNLTIDPGARASFSRRSFQIAGQTCIDAPLPNTIVRDITVNVLPRGSIARTIYVPCGVTGPIAVTATDTATGAKGSVLINSDPNNPGAKGPDGSPLGPESHNPDAENPDAENPDAENPDAENPDAENPDAENPDAENPDAENPDAENPDAENPDAENPDAENPDAENANFQDVSGDVSNDGDTTSGYQVNASVSGDTTGYEFLLMGRRVYSTPTSINCHLVQKNTNQTLFAIPLDGIDLTGAFFDENDPSVKHPTFVVRPGERIRVTLRVVRNAATTAPFCSADPSSADWCFNRVIIRTQAQAPNTGELEPREDAVGNFADLTVDGALAAPAVAGMGGIVDMPATTIRNEGSRSAEPDGTFRWDYYRSLDPEISGRGDEGFDVGDSAESLAPDGTISFGPRRLVMPFAAGAAFYLGVFADADNAVSEGSESNNTLVTPTAVTIAPYFSSISVETFEDPDGGSISIATVSVNEFLGPEASEGVEEAGVALSLERPIAPSNEPGIAEPAFAVMTGVTNADGRVEFVLPPLPGEGSYRFIATVTIAGVPPLKFQSGCFGCLF